MSVNILNLIQDQIGDQLTSQASSFLGESESNVSAALGGIFPSILGKMVDSADDKGLMTKVFDLAKGGDFGMMDDIAGIFTGGGSNATSVMNMGGTFLNLLMGNKTGALIDMIAKFAGLKGSTTSSLLKLAAPFLLKVIGGQISKGGLDLGGFMNLISSQKSHVKTSMPDGLGSLGLLGGLKDLADDAADMVGDAVSGAADFAGDTVDAVGDAAEATFDAGKKAVSGAADMAGDVGEAAVKSGGSLLKWLVPALIILGLLSFFGIKTCSPMDKAGDMVKDTTMGAVDVAGDAAAATADAAGNAANAVGDAAGNAASAVGDAAEGAVAWMSGAFSNVNEAAKKALDSVKFTAGSAGEQMMGFINNGFKGKSTFRFNDLTFNTGSAAITGTTAVEVDNLAAILNTYPDVKISVDGYTDNTGDAMVNEKLSKARADAVKARLMAKGIAGNRVKSMGHGSKNPVASNDTEEGRKANRRIEVSIVK